MTLDFHLCRKMQFLCKSSLCGLLWDGNTWLQHFLTCFNLVFFWTGDNTHPVSEEPQPSTVTVLSHGDNPGFEGDETQVSESRVVHEVTS